MNEEQRENEGLQIDLNPEMAKGVYANLALITHSNTDFVLDFVLDFAWNAQTTGRFACGDDARTCETFVARFARKRAAL